MKKRIAAACCLVLVTGIMGLGCKDELVGAPCIPETDKGAFTPSLSGTTWSIETRSVQCESRGAQMVCLTKTQGNQYFTGSQAACEVSKDLEECWEEDRIQHKFSFCSCRCKDVDENTYNTNPDKFDYLCECPPNTKCEDVLGDIEEAPEKIKGSYCVPNCIARPCEAEKVCSPSKDSEKPWEWACKEY